MIKYLIKRKTTNFSIFFIYDIIFFMKNILISFSFIFFINSALAGTSALFTLGPYFKDGKMVRIKSFN